MSCAPRYDLEICKGTTWSKVIRWEAGPVVYRPISSITQAAPAVVTTVDPHGLPDGWMVAITGVTGMTQINTVNLRYPIKAKVLTANTFELPIDASGYQPYGFFQNGTLRYNTPVDLSGYTAELSIKDADTLAVLMDFTTANGRIVLDNVLKTITLSLSDTVTDAITWSEGFYKYLNMVSASSIVTPLLYGNVSAD